MTKLLTHVHTTQELLIQALNQAAALDPQLIGFEESIYNVFREQIQAMGLRGGISLLDDEKQNLVFHTIAQPGKSRILPRLESLFGRSSKNYTIRVDQVDVYSEVLSSGQAVFSPDTNKIIRQMLPVSEEGFIARVMDVFGGTPGIYCPLLIQNEVVGVLNVAGSDLTEEELPVLKAFANYISAALTNTELVRELKDKEDNYRSLINNLPIGIYRIDPDGRFLITNPVLMDQLQIRNQEPLDQIVFGEVGLRPIYDREQIIQQVKDSGQVIGLETEWQTPQGEKVYFKENLKGTYDKDGNLMYVEGSLEDITDRKQTEETIRKQLADLSLLNQIAAISADQQDLDTLLEQITKIIASRLFSDHFGVLILDPSADVLRVHPSYQGLAPEYFEETFLPGEGITGTVFKTGLPLRVSDVRQFPGYIESDPTLRSELCVPIMAGNRVLGVLNAERTELGGFSADDESLLVTIADQLATAMERALYLRAVENQTLQLTLLNEAAMTTSRVLDPSELIELIATQITNLINPDTFFISLYDESAQELEIAVAYKRGSVDIAAVGMKIPVAQAGLTSLLLDTGEILQIDDLASSPLLVGYTGMEMTMKGSWVGIPLMAANNVIGALTVQFFEKNVLDVDQTQFLESLASNAAIAITNGNLFAEIQNRYALSNHLAKLSESLNRPQTEKEVIQVIGESALSLLNIETGAVFIPVQDHQVQCAWSSSLSEEFTHSIKQLFTESSGDGIGKKSAPVIISDIEKLPAGHSLRHVALQEGIRSISIWPLVYEGKTIAEVACCKRNPYAWNDDEKSVLMTFARQAAISIQNARLLEAERHRRYEAEALYKTTIALTSTLDVDKVLENLLVELYRVVDYSSASLQMLENDVVRIVAVQGLLVKADEVVGMEFSASNQLILEMQQTHEPIILQDAQADSRFEALSKLGYVRGWIGVPLVVGEKMIGCLTIDSDEVGTFNESHAQQAKAFANQAAVAIETASLFSQTQRRLQVLQSIHTIDQAISGSLDLSLTLDVLMEQMLNLLGVDGIRIFSYDSASQMFDRLAQRELISIHHKSQNSFFDEQIVLQAIAKRDMVIHSQENTRSSLTQPNLSCYCVTPLIARGLIRGVIEIFSMKKMNTNDEWLNLIKTLSTQAAIAIENDNLLSSLKKSNDELVSAYDRTLEGWARALELRDRETEGHARRVTELTVKLARRMGIHGVDLANIRRGTLLHDIGKMALPDYILLKEGPLNEVEERIMKTHPQLAYDMLSEIPYLKPALFIPYYHHEKFDGTGYPHGLVGEEIPLPARIFAVVDVWDALISDRPYRKAWTKEKAARYIRDESGKHFDPEVVKLFFEIIE